MKIKNQVSTFPKNIFRIFLPTLFVLTLTVFTYQVTAYDFKYVPTNHHVIFDNLGKLSTGVTYINIAITVNVTTFEEQIDMFSSQLENLLNTSNSSTHPSPPPSNFTTPNITHSSINTKNFETLTKNIVNYANSRLKTLRTQLDTIHTLLPTDHTYDEQNNRHKRFAFLIPMIICEVNKAKMHTVKLEMRAEFDAVQAELEAYKHEYDKLYNETMPELIPEYLSEAQASDLTNDQLELGTEYLTRTRRDVKFLMSIIEQKDGKHILETQPNYNEPQYTLEHTTRNPHLKYNPKFGRKAHKPQTFIKSNTHPNKFFYSRHPNTTTPPTSLTTTTPQPVSLTTNLPREKRFIIATAALVTGVLGTFFGLFNQYEINNMRGTMDEMQNKHNLLVQISQNHEIQIERLQSSLSELETVFNLFLKSNPALLYAQLNDKIMMIQDNISKFKDTVQMLQLQRLSTNALNFHQLSYAYDSVVATAKENNLAPLTNKVQDIFQLDTSYIRIKNQLLIIVHVPCSNPENLLTIYKYVPFPIPVLPSKNKDTKLNTIQDIFELDFSSFATEGIHFSPKSDLIAIGKNTHGRNKYIILSSSDLQVCTKRPQAYICERHQVTRSDLLGSCLGSLYMQSAVGVFENCDINRVNLREQVYQISSTDHIIYTPLPLSTQITCNNGSYFNIKIKQVQQISIPEGCSVELTNHTITSDFSIRLNSESIHFEWDFDPLNFPNSAQFLIDSKSIDSKLRIIENNLSIIKNDTIEPHEFSNLILQHYNSGHWLAITIICFISFSALIGLCTIIVCIRNNILARGRIDESSASYHRRSQSDDDDEDEISRIARTGKVHK